MDIKKKGHKISSLKKRATLKATAAAVITLNSGVVSALSCPPVISSSISGVCTFDGTTGLSVTVADGGAVEGISMNSYVPGADSFITVDSGGQIVAPSQVRGINISGGSILSGSISNSGSISGVNAIRVEGNSTTVGGGIFNIGDLQSAAIGILVRSGATVSGGISNSGSLVSASNQGILVYAGSTVNGGISNNGTIVFEAGAGIAVSSNSTVNGGITNSGLISASPLLPSSLAAGISILTNSSISGGISNTGTINTISDNGQGIYVKTGSSVSGGISNSGTINTKNAGIAVYDNSTVTGDISNAGDISRGNGAASLYGLIMSTNSVLTGSIFNSGDINASLVGIDAAGLSISGSILNSGTIHSANIGIAAISSGTTVSGNISNSGVLNAANVGIQVIQSARVNGDVTNSGSINAQTGIRLSSSSVLIGNISNSGSINAQSGIRVFSGANVSGNITNSGTIQGSNSAINDETSTVQNLNITGQTARIIGSVNAQGARVNITSGSVFSSEGTFNAQSFNIASSALFHMADGITVSNGVNNAGTLSIATGTLQTITGNYTQQATGKYQIGATNSASYGQLSTSGIANLSASGAIDVQVQSGANFHQGEVLSNILAASTFTAPTNGYSVTDNSFLWQFTAESNGTNGVNLILGIDPEAYDVCRGTYCEGAANVIVGQVASGNSVFNPYTSLPDATTLAAAASQATPELTNENLQVTQLITRTVIDVLPMWSTLRGLSSGDAMLYQPGKVWLKPYGASMTQNQRNTVNGYKASVYGLVAGGDMQVANQWMLGGALAAGGNNIRGKSVLSGQSIDSAQYQGLIYTSKLFTNHAYFAAQGLLGYGDNDTKRFIPLYASTAKGSYNSWFTNLSAELGSPRAITERFIFTPAVTASYLYINQVGYTESGSLMDLQVNSNNNSTLVLGADANIAYRATTLKNQQEVTLTGHSGVAYDVINNQPSTISTFVASGPSFSTYGIQYGGAVYRGGVGMTLANPTRPLSVNLNADVQTGNNGTSGIYSATLKYKV